MWGGPLLTAVRQKCSRAHMILPLPRAGEGKGEGEVRAHHPHLYPLPPKGGRGGFRRRLRASSSKKKNLGLRLTLALALSSVCASHAQPIDLPVISDDLDRDSLRLAVRRSLDFLNKVPPRRQIGDFPRKPTAQEVKDSLLLFLQGLDSTRDPRAFGDWVKLRFDFYPVDSAPDKVLFTGYYRPVLQASLTSNRRFRFPIYARPKDLIEAELVTLFPERQVDKVTGRIDRDQWRPYFSRAEIDRGGQLKGKGYEIAWVDDPVALFFLHVQGSGVLRFDNGAVAGIGYAASNGRPYRSIGTILVNQGKIPLEEVTMQRLKRYLKDNPQERDALLDSNERYVFFRFTKAEAMGSLEVPLTPGRSIASDARLFPKGSLAFIVTQEPVLDGAGNAKGWKPVRRFVLNQDTGAAIQGGRVDVYFGTGDRAGWSAGLMKSTGQIFFLIKK